MIKKYKIVEMTIINDKREFIENRKINTNDTNIRSTNIVIIIWFIYSFSSFRSFILDKISPVVLFL